MENFWNDRSDQRALCAPTFLLCSALRDKSRSTSLSGSPAAVADLCGSGGRPVTLRPRLSTGLPCFRGRYLKTCRPRLMQCYVACCFCLTAQQRDPCLLLAENGNKSSFFFRFRQSPVNMLAHQFGGVIGARGQGCPVGWRVRSIS